MSEQGEIKPKWGLYKDQKLVLAHDSKEALEGYLQELVKLHGKNSDELEIKPYSGS